MRERLTLKPMKPLTILHAFGLTDINTIGNLGSLPGKLPNVLGLLVAT